jgi:hypothetical protein
LGLAAAIHLGAALRLAAAPGPQNLVRGFCEADGMGARLPGGRLHAITRLLSWPFDPAWDHVFLITGYRIGPTIPREDGKLSVDVDYAVVGEATVLGFEPVSYMERVAFLLDTPDGTHWQIVSPMVPPHVFGHRVQNDELVASLKEGRGAFLPSSVFVQQLLHAAGWNVPYIPTADLLTSSSYGPVESPMKGDLVVYVQDGVPYHVGVLEGPDRVISSTLNGGIVRTTANAFLGEVSYLRLVVPAALATERSAVTPTPLGKGP